ncbi:MAG: trigger factor, partial [Candidatus Poseidoniia archaeon]|nr:trigger factor [Candidatus Poseidoniia archaeon]
FTFTVPLSPSVDLGDYRSVRVQYQPVEIADEAVEEAMGHLQSEHALLEPIERPVQLGDVLTIDAHGVLNHGDEDAEELADEKDIDLLLEAESEWPMPGLTEKLVGMELDETREFELHFPENYGNEILEGRKVQWTISCKGTKSRTLPALNDDFATLVSGEYETLLELRVAVRKQLEQAAKAQKSREYRREVVDAVLQCCEVSFPPILLQDRVNNLVNEQEQALQSRGLTLADYLKMESKSEDEYRAELEPDAITQLQRSLMLTEVVEAERLKLDDKHVDEQIEKTAATFGDSADKIRAMLRKENGRRSVEMDLLTELALGRLEAIGKGEAPELPPEADAEDTPAANN